MDRILKDRIGVYNVPYVKPFGVLFKRGGTRGRKRGKREAKIKRRKGMVDKDHFAYVNFRLVFLGR